MRPSLSRSALLILWSLWTFAGACTTPSQSQVEANKGPQSFLWEARRGATSITLVGTMHIGIRENDMDPALWQRLHGADTVIIETDLDGMKPQLMRSYMHLPEDRLLSKELGPKHWAKLLTIVEEEKTPLSPALLDHMSPLAVGVLLIQIQAKADKEIEAGQQPIDQIIFERGKRAGKIAHTLETNQEQLESLKAVFSIDSLKKALDDWKKEETGYEDMKALFKRGDSEALDTFLKEIPEDMRYLLLEKRNRNWMAKLPTLLGKQTVLAVGAAHYAGPSGLLELLKKEGYQIRRVQNEASDL